MLQAALRDALQCSDLKIITLRDHRLPPLTTNVALQTETITMLDDFQVAWDKALEQCDAALIIGPESDGLLAQLNQHILDKNKILLGCQPAAVVLTTNKYRCSQHLAKDQLPTPAEQLASQWQPDAFPAPHGFIVKPIEGVGCEETQYFRDDHQLAHWLAKQSPAQLNTLLIQAYIQGAAISLTLLATNTDVHILAFNEQFITHQEESIRFTGCHVNGLNLSKIEKNELAKLAGSIYASIHGLWGIFGIDLIISEQGPVIIDINPRLTTPYVALSESLGINPIQHLIQLKNNSSTSLTAMASPIPVKITL